MRLFEAKDPFILPLEEDEQTRVSKGILAQKAAIRFFKINVPGSRVLRMAGASSKKTDIVVKLASGETINIECKSVTSFVTAYDSVVHRGDTNEFLDWATQNLPENKKKLTFAQMIDAMRQVDKRVGFSGDPGAARTGKVPSLRIQGPGVLAKLRKQIIARYQAKGENYLALVNLATGNVSFHYISGPLIRSLHPSPVPAIMDARFDTYGDPYTKGAVRAAIKVRFQP